jgi:pseudaminic acid cytidylyltransferase
LSLAIIPARGGSKRIPRKNLRPFRGRPIIAWSIEAALESGLFDEVMVSTDDAEIATLARDRGAVVPFMRSADTAGDHATTAAVLEEVLGAYERQGRTFEHACCLYPTAPFATARDLQEGHRRLIEGDFTVVMPVAAFSYPIWRSLRRAGDGRIEMNFPENRDARSQDLPPAYHDAGQWCWFRVEAFRRDGTLLGGNTGSVELGALRVQDIDTEEDWMLAELKHQAVFG